ncbi:glycoside hydrolase family 26 protein [Nocardioides acrostichi]|uniref:Beta-mannanase n=1 Tax=Nocardioides acrostichi TaxID=2784339 RepID=A0A930YA33_9ACTN|nr:glycosyl hydrolase [Nocardioides acrostichi]MBF4161003.1 beta-mannanase [Nocardioides acrostichi]
MIRSRIVRRLALVLCAVTMGVCAVLLAPGAAQAARRTTPSLASASEQAERPFGVTMPGTPGGSQLASLASALGRTPDEVMWYVAWSTQTGFPTTDAARVRDLGATPVITWEPWDPSAGLGQTTYSMKSIAAGTWNGYLKSWARGAAKYGSPVVIRFAHEMNGTWYPWAIGVDGTTSADYVGAWNRMRTVFKNAGATNVTFRWNPNVPYPGSTPMAQAWPGASKVDSVALDGYNWGGTLDGTTWTSFADVFENGLDEMATLTSLPVIAGETASVEAGGDDGAAKAQWITAMFATLADDPRFGGFTWFDYDKENDWRIDSYQSTFDAFRTGLTSYVS